MRTCGRGRVGCDREKKGIRKGKSKAKRERVLIPPMDMFRDKA